MADQVSALEPGLYRWSFGGKSYDGIMDCDGDFNYLSSDGRHCTRGHGYTTDVRPLIVLDLPPERVQYVLEVLGRPAHSWTNIVAAQIEAQTKPARIPEPGLGGSVMASIASGVRDEYHHCPSGWSHRDGSHYWWTSLEDPTLIREGVES